MTTRRSTGSRLARLAPLPALLLAAAACETSVDPGGSCEQCVTAVLITPQILLLAPGDTVQLRAEVRTSGGLPTTYAWRTGRTDVVSVSAGGLVTALAHGQDAVAAFPTADSSRYAYATIAVRTPDSSAVPTLSYLINSATGRSIATGDGRADSVDVGVSYILGRLPGEEATSLQLRLRSVSRDTTITLGLADAVGRGHRAATRLRMSARGADGSVLWPAGTYEATVTLRLRDGRVLGGQELAYLTF